MERIAAELQDSVVDLTRQLTELQAGHDSTRSQLQTRVQSLDQRELQLQSREQRVKSEEEWVRKRRESVETREREVEKRDEQLGRLERSVEERERGLDGMEESLEEQLRHYKALKEVLEDKLGILSEGMRLRLREFEEKASGIGVRLTGCGEEGNGEMRGGLDKEEVVKLIGVILGSEEIAELCQGVDSADKMQDVIRILIERKQLIEAVGFICTFKFTEEFPPVPLLNECVEDAEKWWSETFSQKKSLDEKENVVHDRITCLRAVAQCVKDYSLQSEYSLAHIDNDILELEKLKENLHSVASLDIMIKTEVFGKLDEKREVVLCLPSYDRKNQRKGRKQGFSTLSPGFNKHRRCSKKVNQLAISAASPMTQIDD